jgi:hypothetical protein
MLMLTCGKGKYKVWLEQKKIGNDFLIILGGGEKPHIGGMVICEPGKTPQVIKLDGHYDDVILKPMAEAACTKYKTTVVAVGGIHIDQATKEEINILIENCKTLTKQLCV